MNRKYFGYNFNATSTKEYFTNLESKYWRQHMVNKHKQMWIYLTVTKQRYTTKESFTKKAYIAIVTSLNDSIAVFVIAWAQQRMQAVEQELMTFSGIFIYFFPPQCFLWGLCFVQSLVFDVVFFFWSFRCLFVVYFCYGVVRFLWLMCRECW